MRSRAVVYCWKWRWVYAKGRGEGPEGTLLIYDHWGEYTLSKKPGGWYTPYTRVYPPPIHHCVWLKLFRCRSVPLLEPNPGDATAPRSYVQLLYRPLKFHSLVSRYPVNDLSLRSLGFPKSPPPLKNPRSANAVRDHIFGTTSSPNLCSCYLWLCPPLAPSGVVTCYMYVFPVLWMTSH